MRESERIVELVGGPRDGYQIIIDMEAMRAWACLNPIPSTEGHKYVLRPGTENDEHPKFDFVEQREAKP